MTAQVTNNVVAQPIRVKLPLAALNRIVHRMIVRKQERALRELPDHLLRDIGLNRYDLEAKRSFWG